MNDAQRLAALEAEVKRLAGLLERIATATTVTAKRQVEMRADLLASGAFEKKSAIIMPGRPN